MKLLENYNGLFETLGCNSDGGQFCNFVYVYVSAFFVTFVVAYVSAIFVRKYWKSNNKEIFDDMKGLLSSKPDECVKEEGIKWLYIHRLSVFIIFIIIVMYILHRF